MTGGGVQQSLVRRSTSEALLTVKLGISVAAIAVGELSEAVKWRRGASRVDLRGEVVFGVIFFTGMLALPFATLGRCTDG
ncbi:MAG: hypothetical protein QOF53_2979 [Nocardioidaceae bacterium]|nr:hypothetical protein [Nocardioidaceae bacterium]